VTILDRLMGSKAAPPAPIPAPPAAFKIVTGPGVTAYASDPPLSSWLTSDQQRCAAYLRAYKVGWFNKAERKISTDVAGLAWSISSGDVESEQEENTLPTPDLDIPFEDLNPVEQLMRLLERPNPFQTGKQLIQRTQIRRDMAGTAFWYLEGVAGSPSGLPTGIYGISPARLWPSYDQNNQLIGYVLDRDKPGGGIPFTADEIIAMPMAEAEDDRAPVFGVGVVEAVYAELPLTDLMSRHVTDLLTTGGRLAGMLSPKNRSLSEDEFNDAVRAWRNVASDPNAARRLLLFPEPMEWSSGASTPAEIGIPELASLNRERILTSFPIGPEQLGIPMPSGLNASGESRRELDALYWRGTIHPRVDDLEEIIQVKLVSRYERIMGQTFDYDIEEPDLDDAATVLEKVAAYKALLQSGFDPTEARAAAGLDHIKYVAVPATMNPSAQPVVTTPQLPQLGDGLTANATQARGRLAVSEQESVAKSIKARAEERERLVEQGLREGKAALARFFAAQRERVVAKVRQFPSKAARLKALPDDWWDAEFENAELRSALQGLYLTIGRDSLQIVADQLDKIVITKSVRRILSDLLDYGGDRITNINDRTRDAIKAELTEGVRRGYSLDQLIHGVTAESYAGVQGALLDNGVTVWDDYRAEMIARTETMLSANRAAITGYSEFGIEQVQAIDGDQDEVCAERDGQVFSIDEAAAIEDHPNGTLDWVPVIERKSADETDLMTFVKALASREAPVVNNYLNQPDVNVAPPELTIAKGAVQVDIPVAVSVPAQSPPVVHNYVETPEVTIREGAVQVNVPEQMLPVVNITQPDIVLPQGPAPEVIIAEDAVQAPIVNVEAPEPAVVNVAPPQVIVSMDPVAKAIDELRDLLTRPRKLIRDEQGHIIGLEAPE